MDAAVAETVAKATRDQATQDARADLKELRRLAIEAGRERSRKITKTSRIDTRTGEIRYNPAGRLLRDWYLHVYLNTLRANLGEPAEPIDAQQVEDTAGILRRIRAASEPVRGLQAAGVIRNVAIDDAAHAAAEIVARARTAGASRALLHAGEERFDGDPVRIQVTRHWYQRCYDNQVESATRSQQPLAGLTDAEEHQVAFTLETRRIRRLIGRDGIPLVTAHNTLMNEVDRRLAAGETGVIPAGTDSAHHADALENLRVRVTRSWAELSRSERAEWLHVAGVDDAGERLGWSNLTGNQQTKIIRLYLDTHRHELLDVTFDQPPIRAAAEIAARRMFNHRVPLVGSASDPTTFQVAQEAAVALAATSQTESRQEVQRLGRSSGLP